MDRREVIAVITADASKLDPGLARGKRKIKRWSKDITVELKRGMSTLTSLVGIGGLAGMLAAGKQVFEFQKRLVRLRQSSRESKSTLKDLESQVFKIARARGLDPDQVLGAAEEYTKRTGRLTEFMQGMDKLGKVTAASGAEMNDIAALAASMNEQLDIAPKDWETAFDVLIRGGQEGAVELNDLASIASKVLPMFKRFGEGGVQGLGEMSALLQMTKTGFDTASEAGTGFESLMGSLVKNAKKLKKSGIDVFQKGSKTQLKDLFELTKELKNKSGGSVVKLGKMIGNDKESIKALLAIWDQTAKGRFEELSNVAKAKGTTDKAYKIWEESPAKKMATAQARLAEFFNNTMRDHIDKIATALETFTAALELAAKNWQLVIAALGGKSLYQIITGARGGGAGGGGGLTAITGGGGNGSPSKLDKVATGLVAFGTGYEVGSWLNDKLGISSKVGDWGRRSGLAPGAMPLFPDQGRGYTEDIMLKRAQQNMGMSHGVAVSQEQQRLTDEAMMNRMPEWKRDMLARGQGAPEDLALYRGAQERQQSLGVATSAAMTAISGTGAQLNDQQIAEVVALTQKARLGAGAGGTAMSNDDIVRAMQALTIVLQKTGGVQVNVEPDMRASRRDG